MLKELTEADFKPHVGKTFPLEIWQEQEVVLTLAEVRTLPAPPPGWAAARRQPFALLFHGPRQPAMQQGMFAIVHPTLGRIEAMFLVPVAEDSEGRSYEAVFN